MPAKMPSSRRSAKPSKIKPSKQSDLEYRILLNSERKGCHYFTEIAPGKHQGAHWQADSIYVDEEYFVVAEGIIRRYYPKFFHYGDEIDVFKIKGRRLLKDWRTASNALKDPKNDPFVALNLDTPFFRDVQAWNVKKNRAKIITFLKELADACEPLFEKDGWISILGV